MAKREGSKTKWFDVRAEDDDEPLLFASSTKRKEFVMASRGRKEKNENLIPNYQTSTERKKETQKSEKKLN